VSVVVGERVCSDAWRGSAACDRPAVAILCLGKHFLCGCGHRAGLGAATVKLRESKAQAARMRRGVRRRQPR
jgi:hypothetical protein